jgi:hypothetical protein
MKDKDDEPKFTHERLWVVCMWIGIAVFAVLYFQHPHLLDWTGIVSG